MSIVKAAKYIVGSGLTVTAIYFTSSYFSGGTCTIDKDLTEKVAIITGGNYGIGRETAIELAKRNCNVVIGGRDEKRIETTLKIIKKANGNVKASGHYLHLGDRKSIQEFSKFVESQFSKVDFLINNAGVATLPNKAVTSDGMEMQIGYNHFGHFYFTYKLFPLLKKSEEFRVINVTSKVYEKVGKLNFDDLHYQKTPYDAFQAYCHSKLANIYFTRHFQRLLDMNSDKLNGISVSVHPGIVRTEISRYFQGQYKFLLYAIYPILAIFTKNSNEGAQTTLYTVLEDKKKLVPSKHYADCKLIETILSEKDKEYAEKLWNLSEKAYGVKFDF